MSRPIFHFMNASRFLPGKFSCAIDCFLEVWIHSLSALFPASSTSLVLGILKYVYTQYMVLKTNRATAYELHLLRSDIWDLIKHKCPSFESMDINAEFSEIFRRNLFFRSFGY